MGSPKQLLSYKGKSLLQNMVSVAAGTGLNPVVVVVGANADPLEKEIAGDPIHIINNTDWQEGIASSIRAGIRALEKIDPSADGVILMVCDQPHISSALLKELYTVQQQTGKPIVAAGYGGVNGTPVLFHKTFFPELLLLKGDKGAGKILHQQKELVVTVSFPQGAIDIDTPENYEALRKNE
jgi:molybdenum cofactor cytidylyltransferase